ncbi:multidrug effflux MFS transporter [Psychromonas sp. 14N.309.X.WAT.B.A12]|uniref:multidrug effflux MFS transporter n=1 Tax=Psychromonas sp. 14N.309.X.WAT.B.A12 TaxID=2998322 RepID=UPI0025B138C1|nr:multidrug effflux MFS transporter [Psychromonas sp. 14N.309.X.WAT.B.A12]MDN2662310.1 multidrug effflux MFS transporter [Psychromonas sp. 14N.309.X.WAT.B.A12]
MSKHISTSLLLLLAGISALTPFATDGYLSAIPIMAKDLNTDISMVAVTVSLYIFGLAIGQLVGGPLSDKFGRKSIIVVGLIIFTLGSFAIPYAHSLEMLWTVRMIQALGGGIAVVGVPAIIRDNAQGKDAARLFSLIMLITMLAPSIAPSVGTLILKLSNWGWIFTSLAIVGAIVAVATLLVMPTEIKVKQANKSGGYLSVFKEKRALGFLLAQGFSFSVLMTFLTNAPFAYIAHFGVSETFFSVLLILNVAGVSIVNRVNTYLLHKYEPNQLLKSFLIVQLTGAVILIVATAFFPESLWLTVLGFVAITATMGGVIPNSSACFMNYFGKNAGVAAATLGATQYMLGAAISALAALLSYDSLWPIVCVMTVATVIAYLGGAIKQPLSSIDVDAKKSEI